jgi:hypothetical protein
MLLMEHRIISLLVCLLVTKKLLKIVTLKTPIYNTAVSSVSKAQRNDHSQPVFKPEDSYLLIN